MYTLRIIIQDFWNWCGIDKQEYSTKNEIACKIEPFYYPRFEELKYHCRQLINKELLPEQMDDFLTCIALDSEVEDILQWCKELANDAFLDVLVSAGCHHLLSEARWQIAELLRCRSIQNRSDYLDVLCTDPDAYVRKRALNAKSYILAQTCKD